MRSYPKQVLTLFLLFFILPSLSGQLKLSAEFRPRFEYRQGYKTEPESTGDPSFLLSIRSRLEIFYTHSKIKFGIIPQDTRVFNNQPHNNNTGIEISNPGIHFREIWAGYFPGENLSIRIGRQITYINDQRLMAKRNWGQDGLGYDMLEINFKNSAHEIKSGLSYNFLSEKNYSEDYPNADYKSFNFLYYKGKIGESQKIALLTVLTGNNDSLRSPALYYQKTAGICYETGFINAGINLSLYYQFGKNSVGEKVDAFMADLHGFLVMKDISFKPGTSVLSGDRIDKGSKTDNTFDLLYGVRHTYYGMMDHFSETDEATGYSGFMDNYLLISDKGEKKLRFEAGLHVLSTLTGYYKRDETLQKMNKLLAFEADFIGNYHVNENLTFETGYCFLVPSKTFNALRNIQHLHSSSFIYLMVTFHPLLYNNNGKPD